MPDYGGSYRRGLESARRRCSTEITGLKQQLAEAKASLRTEEDLVKYILNGKVDPALVKLVHARDALGEIRRITKGKLDCCWCALAGGTARRALEGTDIRDCPDPTEVAEAYDQALMQEGK